jgi:hypothetical protein
MFIIIRVYNKTENYFNKNVWIPAFAGMTGVERSLDLEALDR